MKPLSCRPPWGRGAAQLPLPWRLPVPLGAPKGRNGGSRRGQNNPPPPRDTPQGTGSSPSSELPQWVGSSGLQRLTCRSSEWCSTTTPLPHFTVEQPTPPPPRTPWPLSLDHRTNSLGRQNFMIHVVQGRAVSHVEGPKQGVPLLLYLFSLKETIRRGAWKWAQVNPRAPLWQQSSLGTAKACSCSFTGGEVPSSLGITGRKPRPPTGVGPAPPPHTPLLEPACQEGPEAAKQRSPELA